jgi:alpha-tubulin suppressor-like RCC1 family protein
MKSRCISFDLVTIEVIFLILFGLIVTSYAVIPKISWGADCTVENKWVSTAAGKSHSLGIKSDGTLWAWGGNIYGQLGDSTTTERHSPVQIDKDNKWTSISAGYFNTLALKSDGTLWTWGGNEAG